MNCTHLLKDVIVSWLIDISATCKVYLRNRSAKKNCTFCRTETEVADQT